MPALLWDCVNVSMPLARSTHSGALGTVKGLASEIICLTIQTAAKFDCRSKRAEPLRAHRLRALAFIRHLKNNRSPSHRQWEVP